ncbi:MAG: UbiX family flavin prenyltransferase [Lentimicrobiaceae bacterium]|nr:UbiX family flavin prenyltransferase [Lentimicrobiaceae bacterium]
MRFLLKIIVGITGASGTVYGQMLLNKLQQLTAQIADCRVIFSSTAKQVWEYELQNKAFTNIPFTVHEPDDFFAPFASGSSSYDAMIICPCSMGTLGRIAAGTSGDLLTRAADVMLKERKKLLLVTRESPLSLIHINNMKTVTEAGGIIFPASPSFYNRPQNIDELVATIIDRVLLHVGFDMEISAWGSKEH